MRFRARCAKTDLTDDATLSVDRIQINVHPHKTQRFAAATAGQRQECREWCDRRVAARSASTTQSGMFFAGLFEHGCIVAFCGFEEALQLRRREEFGLFTRRRQWLECVGDRVAIE